eukprot:2267677-Pleurochrysis_carterae.AAC.1
MKSQPLEHVPTYVLTLAQHSQTKAPARVRQGARTLPRACVPRLGPVPARRATSISGRLRLSRRALSFALPCACIDIFDPRIRVVYARRIRVVYARRIRDVYARRIRDVYAHIASASRHVVSLISAIHPWLFHPQQWMEWLFHPPPPPNPASL